MGDLAGWSYWKVISITGQSGAGTDYQVELEMGDSAGGDFHLEGHCTNFPQDIRITDDDGTTLLDHWVEDITADPIVVHVKVKDDLGSNRDIRVYYGKSGETSASNGDNTFIQYSGAADIVQSVSSVFENDNIVPPSNVIYESKIKRGDEASCNFVCGLGNTNDLSDDAIVMKTYSVGNYRQLHQRNEGGATVGDSEAPAVPQNADFTTEIIISSTIDVYVNDDIIGNGNDSIIANEDMSIYAECRAASTTAHQYWAFVREYNSPEPAFSSAGAEQTPTGAAPTSVFYGPLVGPFGGPI